MEESIRTNQFLSFLFRIRSARILSRRDSQSIRHLAVKRLERDEQPIPYTNQEAAFHEFRAHGLRTFPNEDAGLQSLGWKKLTCGPKLPQGSFATIRMAYKLSDRGTPLESRHLAVAKVQDVEQVTWTEVQILRGVVHENIIDFYGVFAVDTQWRSEYADHYPSSSVPERRDLYMLLEYANAGDLTEEVLRRYEARAIPENGARYYMLQICKGIEYLHSKRVIHRFLQPGHILLKYDSEGGKVCMICDFRISIILGPEDVLDEYTRGDVAQLSFLLSFMVQNHPHVSEEAKQVIRVDHFSDDHSEPYTVTELLSYPWFRGPAVPPMPSSPTPLLQPEAVEQIGYLQPMDPAGTTSPPTEPQFGPVTRDEFRPVPFAQRMRRNLRAVPDRVATRFRSLTGREPHRIIRTMGYVAPVSRSPSPESSHVSEQHVEEERRGSAEPGPSRRSRDRQPSSEHGSAHGRVSYVARSPSTESSHVRLHHLERRGTAEAEPDRPSRTSRVRDRLTSMGRAIARPFRRSSRRSDH